MQLNHTLDKKDRDSLKDLITFFGFRVPHLQMVKVDKMIYIAQLYHYSRYGELMTNVPFLSLSRGPHSPVIKTLMEELIGSGVIYIERNRSEIESANPCLLIKCDTPSTEKLSNTCLNTLEEVLKEWGKEKFGKVLDYFARTIPFISTPYKEVINFRNIPPFAGLKESLPLRQRTSIHRFVQSPCVAAGDESDWDHGATPVSVHEVAEIYLCLCGTGTRGILSPEYRGFDVREVLEILEALDMTHGNDPKVKETDIRKAAECTRLFARSGCFRHENEKVALQVGMFFLKKRGYSLDHRFLETNSFKGNGYEETRAWFERITTGN